MSVIRLDNEERRNAIVARSVPLFARKGFAGTTTKEIAEAAGISEALVFKHFPTKAALYEAIVGLGCREDPAMCRLQALEPSTETLILSVEFFARHFLVGVMERDDHNHHLRLIVISLLDDGEYARLAFRWLEENIFPHTEACLRAAQAAGDLVDIPISFINRFWFSHQLAVMLGCARLPGREILPAHGDMEERISDMVWFILRGLGVKDDVIASSRTPAFSARCAAL